MARIDILRCAVPSQSSRFIPADMTMRGIRDLEIVGRQLAE